MVLVLGSGFMFQEIAIDVLYITLIEHCRGLLATVKYNTEWYNMPISTRKLLLMIMMRSIKPMVLTASKLMILSYVTFNTMMHTSMSYFMLLRSVT
ncbi:odorant receptor 4-like [Linepithema humile]|uniref:odorant receptor 4-like n=1 Tax=Linepithema humile TaxID=83485 RepID=UPI00351F0724